MYLRSITLKGFKSFPERTRLEFGPGVSVIVGPNGSGKSNITDAVLWALGEQSPAAVRGQAMQDVIFAGTPGRAGSQAAEVELVLDDSEGALGVGAPEVSVLRRLDRAGEGEYRMSGARCRLVDVIELLSDTGLGREMHSVISQGRVESIVTSKPRDRRLLIEEAAGLGKHRKRRRRAQLKLARTQDNLDRALDVEREARTRLRPLKRQAEAAELHVRLERQALQVRWELARADLRSRLAELEQSEARAAGVRARRERVEGDLEAVARRRQQAEEALASRSARREELSRRLFGAQSAAERLEYRGEAVRAAARTVESRLERTRARLDAIRAAPEVPDGEAAREQRIASLKAELEGLDRDRASELELALAELEQERVQLEERVADLTDAAARAAAERQEVERQTEEARAAVQASQRGLQEAKVEAGRVGGELAAVNQFLRSHGDAPGGAPRLAAQLEVEPGYELAVAAALDGRLAAAVVDNRRSAEQLLDRAGPEGGRALILELQAAGAADDEGDPPEPGAQPLAEQVRGSGQAAELARHLLGGAWVVSSLDRVDAGFRGLAVSREGRVLYAAAAELRQAPAWGEERVLAQRNQRAALLAEVEQAASAERTAQAGLEQAHKQEEEVLARLHEAITAHRRAVGARDEASEHGQRLAARIARRREEPEEGPIANRRRAVLAELRAEEEAGARAERERQMRRSQIERLDRFIAEDVRLLPEIRLLIEAVERARAAVAERRAEFEAALAADREVGEHVAVELRACAQEEGPLQAQLHQIGEELTESEVGLHRARDRAAETEHELNEVASSLELEATPAPESLADDAREALVQRSERLARRREQLGPVNPLAAQEYADAVEHVEELERQRTDLETALRELEKLISDTDRQIRETFQNTFEAAARNFEHVVAQLFPGGRGRLRLVAERATPAPLLGGGSEAVGAEPPEEAEPVTEEEDVLGVELEINPAGKEMKRLSLLSGGEKSMTALAFLFAVFLARPCPFYILDEVEAALDDVNIDRFLALLRSYSGQAQFIVVTHQRRTMEAADFLYGVSMGGDGISKVISRRLPAVDPAPPARAAA